MSKLSEYRDLLNPLLLSQHLAVLSTYYDGQPYSNLVAFAATNDLKHILFATSRNTRKYDNLCENKKVAMLIDSRKNETSDFVFSFEELWRGIAKLKLDDMSI